MRRRDAELQSDTQRLRQRHPPSASPNGRGEGGGEEGWRGEGGGVEGGRGEGGKGGRPALGTEVWVWLSSS